jgi:hypothetical protein
MLALLGRLGDVASGEVERHGRAADIRRAGGFVARGGALRLLRDVRRPLRRWTRTLVGGPVAFVDLTGDAQPFFQTAGGGTASLLRALRQDSSFRDHVASGDVIMIATGPNELGRAFDPYAKGHCGEGFACVQRLERFWAGNFDVILDEIDRLRGTRPTAIRLVSAANFFVSDPSATRGLPADAMEFGAKLFEALDTAECDAARNHDAVCVDVRPVLNGPTLDQPVDENSPESMQAVADALLATGLPELER